MGGVRRLCFVPLKRRRERDRARNIRNHDQQTRIMASNKHKLEELLRDNSKSSYGDTLPQIQRVQPYLRGNNSKYYSPKLVSFGLIHHDKEHLKLQQGEKYKSKWAGKYLESKSQETIEQLFQKIVVKLPKLKGFYTKDAIKGYTDEDLAWIFFLDGCALLYFMENASAKSQQKLKIKVDQLLIVQQDLLLLENQLPFRLLELLNHANEPLLTSIINKFFITLSIPDGVQWKEKNTNIHEEVKEKVYKPTPLLHYVRKVFIKNNEVIIQKKDEIQKPIHLLHYVRNVFIKNNEVIIRVKDEIEEKDATGDKPRYTHRNIQELKASGI